MAKQEQEQIIKSLLWTDLYKLTMGQAVLNNYPDLTAGYKFINRGKTQFPPGFAGKMRDQISGMSELKLTDREEKGITKRGAVFESGYLDFLRNYRFNPQEVCIDQYQGDLEVSINGPWNRTIYWVVPLMTTISELYYRETGQQPENEWREKALRKGKVLRENGVKIIEFGTRRSFSTVVHEGVLESLIQGGGLPENGGIILGTSNVALALSHDIPFIGTYAHEWVMAHAALFGAGMANEKAMDVWLKEYQGKFAIALTDTFTTDIFLKSFSPHYAGIFDGVRQDSGNPFEIAEKIIAHHLSLGIDPLSKKIVFSDGLSTKKAIALSSNFKNRIQTLFGIGTHFTNDVGVDPLNIVVKLFSIGLPEEEIIPVAKLSDDKGKESGDKSALIRTLRELDMASGKEEVWAPN